MYSVQWVKSFDFVFCLLIEVDSCDTRFLRWCQCIFTLRLDFEFCVGSMLLDSKVKPGQENSLSWQHVGESDEFKSCYRRTRSVLTLTWYRSRMVLTAELPTIQKIVCDVHCHGLPVRHWPSEIKIHSVDSFLTFNIIIANSWLRCFDRQHLGFTFLLTP